MLAVVVCTIVLLGVVASENRGEIVRKLREISSADSGWQPLTALLTRLRLGLFSGFQQEFDTAKALGVRWTWQLPTGSFVSSAADLGDGKSVAINVCESPLGTCKMLVFSPLDVPKPAAEQPLDAARSYSAPTPIRGTAGGANKFPHMLVLNAAGYLQRLAVPTGVTWSQKIVQATAGGRNWERMLAPKVLARSPYAVAFVPEARVGPHEQYPVLLWFIRVRLDTGAVVVKTIIDEAMNSTVHPNIAALDVLDPVLSPDESVAYVVWRKPSTTHTTLAAVNVTTGALKWSQVLPASLINGATAPTLIDGMLVVAGRFGNHSDVMLAYRATNGQYMWMTASPQGRSCALNGAQDSLSVAQPSLLQSSMSAQSKLLITYGSCGIIHAVDPFARAVSWAIDLDVQISERADAWYLPQIQLLNPFADRLTIAIVAEFVSFPDQGVHAVRLDIDSPFIRRSNTRFADPTFVSTAYLVNTTNAVLDPVVSKDSAFMFVPTAGAANYKYAGVPSSVIGVNLTTHQAPCSMNVSVQNDADACHTCLAHSCGWCQGYGCVPASYETPIFPYWCPTSAAWVGPSQFSTCPKAPVGPSTSSDADDDHNGPDNMYWGDIVLVVLAVVVLVALFVLAVRYHMRHRYRAGYTYIP